ncbi:MULTISPECIES: DUF7524 family protein [Methanoculleus]|jgi:hypothetical protein|uniref:Uncharacterized protein n=2 Tax=Methanoculleus TaxID=45989 RepID=A3CRE2_METMJ|nr:MULTISPECIES: hypothetical protein [Methanoculleus]ABN55942.1 hypothetical protein Memar_0007 [Methanoculleus marisnigri JR1]MCC7555055.1 hypothetical protein [Methanoculleus marisnigri]UYU17428.1 hypothetical protein OH143_06820 [Methanoculleus submarinus]
MTEIHLNRRGINSIEVPDEVEATPGSDLVLRIINHGSPLHITLASPNSSAFTGFFHENLYVSRSEEFSIPIRENGYPGTFNIEVIAGYGTRKAEFRVVVRERAAPEPEPVEVPATPAVPATSMRWRSSVPVLLLAAAALVLYVLWLVYRVDLLNAAAFAVLLIGVVLAWLRQRS